MKKELELYVHIPFCVKKCEYCDFLSFSAKQEEVSAYVEALAEEIKGKKEQFSDYCVTTIFLGGGTPSILEGVYTASIFRALRESFDIAEKAEITMEVNPGTVSEEKINMWKTCGVNRLSIGLQSVDDGELKMLGRIHTYDEFLTTWKMVRKAGFHNVNIDLISAIPGQTKKSWETTLRTVAQLQPEHISAYSLIIEEGTVFGTIYGEDGERICQKELLSRESSMPEVSDKDGNIRKDRQILPLPDEDTERAIYEITEKILREYGYERYEISNYAKPGYECRHNLGYWERREYLGLGLGASSLIAEHRFCNTDKMDVYIRLNKTVDPDGKKEESKKAVWEKAEEVSVLSVQEQMEEFMFLGLRKTDGVSEKSFFETFGVQIDTVYGETIGKLEKERLLIKEKGQIRLTERGVDISNYVMSEFLF